MARSKPRTPTRTVSRRQFVARGAAVEALAGRALDDVSAVRAAGQAAPGASSSLPSEPAKEACTWFDECDASQRDSRKMGRENAIRLSRLRK